MAASWYLAPSLAQLRTEVDRRWPGRSRASDGTIGDLAHSARNSEHNPDSGGVVRAIDITVAGLDKAALLAAVIGDSRVHYVISDRRIYSRHSGWKPKPYSGPNPHTKHVHVSIRNATSESTTAAVRRAAATDTSPWFKTPRVSTPDRATTTSSPIERLIDSMDEKQLRKIIREEAQAAVDAALWEKVIPDSTKTAVPQVLRSSWRNVLIHIVQRLERIEAKVKAAK